MARQIEPESLSALQRTHYPWAEWMKGAWEVTHGEDFTCSPESFVVYLHKRAKIKGMKVRTSKTEGGSTPTRVRFRFYRPTARGVRKKSQLKEVC